jgi:hypothetical protein
LDDLAQRWDANETALETALDRLEMQGASAVKQRLRRDDAQTSDVRWGIWPLDPERALVEKR